MSSKWSDTQSHPFFAQVPQHPNMPQTPRKSNKSTDSVESPAVRTRSSSRTPNRKRRSLSELTEESAVTSGKQDPQTNRSQSKTPSRRRSKSRDSSSSHVADPATDPVTPAQPETTLNVAVHRLRNLSYQPAAIVTMASHDTMVAVSRQDATVDIRLAHQTFRVLTTIPCPVVVTALAWTNQAVLVGASDDGRLWILNLATRTCCHATHSDGGAVLCLEAHGDVVAAGCENGTVRFIQASVDKGLLLQGILPTMGAPVLSVAWNHATLYAGVADGTIRRYDRQQASNSSGRLPWKATFRMTIENLGRNIPTRVWSLLLLKDGTVVSGDSLGNVQFWDGMSGTLLQSFPQNENKADVLSIDVSSDQTKVFASGIDSRVVCMARLPQDVPGTDASRPWTLSHAQRPHTHDVRAVIIVKKSENKEILCTGGVDTKFCTYSVARFSQQRPRVIYPWPSSDVVKVAKDRRILYTIRGNGLYFYHLPRMVTPDVLDEEAPLVPEEPTRLGSIKVKGAKHIPCSSITRDGNLLAVADQSSLYLFALRYDTVDDNRTMISMKPRKLEYIPPTKQHVACLHFTAQNELIVASSSGEIFVSCPLKCSDEDDTLDITWGESFRSNFDVPHAISMIISTENSQMIACVSPDLQGNRVDVFYRGSAGNFAYYWRLPDVSISQNSVAFLPGDTPLLAAVSVNYEPFVFDLANRVLAEWNPEPASAISKLPGELRSRRDHPVRLVVTPIDPKKLLVSSFGAFVAFDLNQPFPTTCMCFPEKHVRVEKNKKRKLSVSEKSADTKSERGVVSKCTLCLRYNSMLCLDYLNANEMVIAEQPWTTVVASLPEALDRKIYGS